MTIYQQSHDSNQPSEQNVPVMPTDEEIISDWRRHDAFRFRSVLFPILIMLLITFGQWTSSPWIDQIKQQRNTFGSWGSILDITSTTWTIKVLGFGIAPLIAVIFFNPIPSRSKMRFVIGLTLLSSLLQALSLLNAGSTAFYISQFTSSFAFGLTAHTVIITLLGWFPDFSIFVFASIALVSMLSHWFNLAIGIKIASIFSLPTLPIVQGLIFMSTVIPLHFFIQSPPLYIPLFIRSMLHAASLPSNVTLPLPTTLGIAARIPRALGKLQQWKKKLKSKGARRGYGELVNIEDIDQMEEVEMDVAQGFDLHGDDLDDIYGQQLPKIQNSNRSKGSNNNNVYNNNTNQQSRDQGCELQEIVIHQITSHDPNDALAMVASSKNNINNQNNTNNLARKTGANTAQAPPQFARPGDEDDDGDADFALNDDDFVGATPTVLTTTTAIPLTTTNPTNTTNTTPAVQTIQQPNNNNSDNNNEDEFISVYPNEVEFDPSSAPFQEYGYHDDELTTNSSQNIKSKKQITYRHQVGAALNAVVSQLDQYSPLSIPQLLESKPFQLFLLSAVLPLIFPYLLLQITPTIYYHLQNRSEDDATSIFNTTITVVSIFTFLLLLVAQFFGNKGVLTTSLIFVIFSTATWAPFALMGKQYDNTTKNPEYNPLHIIIAILYIGSMTYCFLIFPALQKYFHDENVRVLSALIIATLAATYISSPVLLFMRDQILDQTSYSPQNKIAINALAYNWTARMASIFTFLGIFALYRTRPLAVSERRFKC